MKDIAIVLSAGKGTRMGSEVPKQYLKIMGKPVLYYTLKAFEDSDVDEIAVVLSESDRDIVEKIIEKYSITKVKYIVNGGAERYHSVFNGLSCLKEARKVLIHDGARPLILPEHINQILRELDEKSTCVAGMPVKDTIKILDENNYVIDTPERSTVWQIQTPQGFFYSDIMKAYKEMMKQEDTRITDDAMVMERYGDERIYIKETSYDNIKITTQDDLVYMMTVLTQRELAEEHKDSGIKKLKKMVDRTK